MKDRFIFVLIALFGVVALPLGARAQAPGYKGPDARQIRMEYRAEVVLQMNDVMGAWGEAWTADDAETAADLYTEDAVVFPAGEDPIRGREAILAWLGEVFPGYGAAEAYLQDFEASGGMAMAHSSYRIEVLGAGAGGGQVSGDLITILMLRGNRWKIRSQVFREH